MKGRVRDCRCLSIVLALLLLLRMLLLLSLTHPRCLRHPTYVLLDRNGIVVARLLVSCASVLVMVGG